jgi:hypothetical protein
MYALPGLLAGGGFLSVMLAAAPAEAACNVPTGQVAYPNAVTGVFTNSPNRPLEAWSDDTTYASVICNNEFSSENWSRYSMDEGDWDNGRGFTNFCDTTRMLGKTYIAYWLMLWSSPTPPSTWDDYSGNILRWGAPWATDNIDEVDGSCSWGLFGKTQYGVLVDNWTKFYLDFAYMETPAVRASTVLHEARHAHGGSDASHNGNDGSPKCASGGSSCDESYSDSWSGRANSIQVWFLDWYWIQAVNTNSFEKNWARVRGNWILDNRFDNVPNKNI